MKKLNLYFFTFIAAAVLITSCGKEGAVGPAGSTGAQGAVGSAGPAGANGTAGSVIYSGNATPPSATGALGDFYINLSTGLLYGPKTTAGWGTGFSLVGSAGAAGAAGANGAAGSQIYSGTTTPSASTGITGDFYLDNTTYMLYGPKTSAGWGSPLNLQGPEGNANVKTDVFSLTSAQWLWNSQYAYSTSNSSYTEYFTRYSVRLNNTVTQDVLSNGLVLVYFIPSASVSANQWAPLPYEFTDGSGNFNYNYAYETSPGQVKLHFFFVQLVASATIPTLSIYSIATASYKIVTITGQTGTFMLLHHTNLNNYQDVSKITGMWQQDKLGK